MLSLDSHRWTDLSQAYGTAGDIPGLIKAIAESDPAEMRKHPTPWKEVWNSLWHQGSVYPATYAAVPHLVSIAEQNNLTTRLEVLIFCGMICAHGELVAGPLPDDLIEPFDSAMKTIRGLSLDAVRGAVAEDLLGRYPLPYLIKALLAVRFGAYSTICVLDKFEDGCDFEAECPECESSMYIDLEDIPSESVDQSARTLDLEHGLSLIQEKKEDEWPSDCIVQIGAALASIMGDESLSAKILNLRSNVVCSSCGNQFLISEERF